MAIPLELPVLGHVASDHMPDQLCLGELEDPAARSDCCEHGYYTTTTDVIQTLYSPPPAFLQMSKTLGKHVTKDERLDIVNFKPATNLGNTI